MKHSTYFISDLHLDETRPGVLQFFHRFLDAIESSAGALYILGDFFEAWIGDDAAAPWQNEIADRLKRLSQSGCDIFLMHGNRDFLLGDDFAQRCGGKLLPDPWVTDIHGRRVVLLHGDSLCTDDHRYQKFRSLTRDQAWQQTVLARPVEDRLKLAQQLRTMSQADNSTKAQDIMDVNALAVAGCFDASDCHLMIHGHTHRPALHATPAAASKLRLRYVLGDWHEHMHYIRANDEGIRLLRLSPDHLAKPANDL
ncbi:UDP-2,3-diacylglucosamine diphosphatase [Allohahella marinimesophila]|uniref:UDP-2,3-diacylglucosamine hydrolase n=1 Tax=Allohahella marinimesophila TaxID=1054972 RepID=A0ABP7NR75_9GAMM